MYRKRSSTNPFDPCLHLQRYLSEVFHAGEVEDLEKCGRTKKTSVKEDKILIEAIQNEPGMTKFRNCKNYRLEETHRSWPRMQGMPVKWFMTEKQKKDRLRWAKEHIEKDKKL